MHLRKFLYLLKFKGVEAVQNFKYGIKNHQVPNVEVLFQKLLPNLDRFGIAVWGFKCCKSKRNTNSIKI